ncbi:MAG: hypothetical protein ACP5NS_03030 [Candidatus Pacearchaeota archaeon]
MALTDRFKQVAGTPSFFNSGVLDISGLGRDRTNYVDIGKGFSELVKQGLRVNHTLLYMAPRSLSLPFHCHPGGEIATVIEGEYFDADQSGNRIQVYGPGSVVVYSAFSTHRPLSESGATISYTTLDGILFPGKSMEIQAGDMEKLLERMRSAQAPQSALDWASILALTD